MVFEGIRSRINARTHDMGFPNGTAKTVSSSPTSSAPARPQSVLFKNNTWSKLRARTRFRILDFLLNCALFTPLAVLFQVGASGIQDFLFLKYATPFVGTVALLCVGIGVEFGCSCWQHRLSDLRVIKENDPSAVSFVVSTRLYHYAIGFANVCHYRGLSDIYYYLLGNGGYAALQAVTTSVIALLCLKCVRNVLGAPLCVSVDSSIEEYFETSTLFRTKLTETRRYVYHLADHAVTVLTVTSLCFLHWISVWALFDAILYPDNLTLSVVMSWVLGHTIVTVSLLMEPTFKKISQNFEKRNRKLKVLFEDAVLLAANAGVILTWRGHWLFFESLAYYFPIYHNGTDMSAFYGNFSSFIMMCLLHTSGTLIMKGCDFDGDLDEGQGLAFGIDYFAEFFQEEIKIEEEIEAEEARKQKGSVAQSTAVLNNNTYRKSTSSDVTKNISPRTLADSDRQRKKEA